MGDYFVLDVADQEFRFLLLCLCGLTFHFGVFAGGGPESGGYDDAGRLNLINPLQLGLGGGRGTISISPLGGSGSDLILIPAFLTTLIEVVKFVLGFLHAIIILCL